MDTHSPKTKGLLHILFQALLCICVKHAFLLIEFICYDDGCHLCKYARHSTRCNLTPTAKKLAEVKIVIDKMHIMGHVDKWSWKTVIQESLRN